MSTVLPKDSQKKRALSLRSMGLSYEEIGNELGISPSLAYKWVTEELDKIQSEYPEDVQNVRLLEAGRLDSALHAIWPRVLSGDLNAVDAFLKIGARRAKLLGLDAPQRHFLQATTEGVDQLFGGGLVQELVGISWDTKMLPAQDVVDGEVTEVSSGNNDAEST